MSAQVLSRYSTVWIRTKTRRKLVPFSTGRRLQLRTVEEGWPSRLPLNAWPTKRHQILNQYKILRSFLNTRMNLTFPYNDVNPWLAKGLLMQRKVRNPYTGLDRPWSFQEVEALRFQECRRMELLSLSALRTDRLYTTGNIPGTISVRDWVELRAIVLPEGLCQWKIPIKPSGIEPATFGLVAQCLNQPPHRVHQLRNCQFLKKKTSPWSSMLTA
jgi:hypothetical protein